MTPPSPRYLTLEDWLRIIQEAARQGGKILPETTLLHKTGLSPGTLRKALQRLVKKGLLDRLGPRLYLSRIFPPLLEEAAMSVGRPCYVSFESALSRHGILSQSPLVLTCATRRKPKSLRTALGEVRLRHISGRLFWGFREEAGVLWAEPEKALLDWIYWRRKTQGRAPALDELALEDLDGPKLMSWARRYPLAMQESLRRFLRAPPRA